MKVRLTYAFWFKFVKFNNPDLEKLLLLIFKLEILIIIKDD